MHPDQFHLLIADDEVANVTTLKTILGMTGYNVTITNSGADALDILRKKHIDLLILDIMMPDMTGLQVLQIKGDDDKIAEIPVIVVSAMTGVNYIGNALELGASDYVRKPVERVELLARVKTVLRMKHKDDELVKLNKELVRHNEIITANIESANLIQKSLLPQKDILQDQFTGVAVYFRPKEIVSGDFYWFFPICNKVYFVEFDCTGHGVYGAFLSLIGYTSLNKIIVNNENVSPANVLSLLNKEFTEQLNKNISKEEDYLFEGMDATVACVDYDSNTVAFASASQLIIYFDNENMIHEIDGDLFSLGYENDAFGMKNVEFTDHIFPLDSIRSFFISSDGITDQYDSERIIKYGKKRLLSFLANNREAIFDNVEATFDAELKRWRGKTIQTDDILIIGVKV